MSDSANQLRDTVLREKYVIAIVSRMSRSRCRIPVDIPDITMQKTQEPLSGAVDFVWSDQKFKDLPFLLKSSH